MGFSLLRTRFLLDWRHGYEECPAKTYYSYSPEYNEMVLSLLKQSARSGNAESMSRLGAMHACGDGVPKNYNAAIALLRRAADKGNALALYNLGVMHAEGMGVAPDA
jgi:TPR repeat protein